ncbi:hypothetical protein EDD11_005782 [Mortierella claussenii]|nr:hypothetical protein EDD11_005782 [Mortierella claussenii]
MGSGGPGMVIAPHSFATTESNVITNTDIAPEVNIAPTIPIPYSVPYTVPVPVASAYPYPVPTATSFCKRCGGGFPDCDCDCGFHGGLGFDFNCDRRFNRLIDCDGVQVTDCDRDFLNCGNDFDC